MARKPLWQAKQEEKNRLSAQRKRERMDRKIVRAREKREQEKILKELQENFSQSPILFEYWR